MDLKDSTFGSLLRDAWILYSNNLAHIWKVYGFLVLASVFLYFLNALFREINSLSGQTSFFVAFIAALIFSMLVNVAYYIQVLNCIEEKDETIQQVFFRATPIFWPFVFTTIIHGFLLAILSIPMLIVWFGGLTFLGLNIVEAALYAIVAIPFILPAAVAYIFWVFFREAVIYRKQSLIKALDYSFKLVRNRWFKVAKYFVGFLIALSPFYILMYLSSYMGWVVELMFFVGLLFFSAWISIAQILFFFHLEQTSEHPHFAVTKKLTAGKWKVKASSRSKKKGVKKATKKKTAKKKTAKKTKKSSRKTTSKRKPAKRKSQKKASSRKKSSKKKSSRSKKSSKKRRK